jgi:glycosyltransferase involved in cell wall biosynthesis
MTGDWSRPFLSIVIPAHNEELRLPRCLTLIEAFLKSQPFRAEVLIVENGSHDRTMEVAREYAATRRWVRALQVEGRGKGQAVRAGMLAARGDYRFMCDVDLSMPIEEVVRFLPPRTHGYDLVIASRQGEGARRVGEPLHRYVMGRVHSTIVKLLAIRGFKDTQCGFKMFSRRAAEDLFRVQRIEGIGFDVELLLIARSREYRILQVPIVWHYDSDSRIQLVQDSLGMLRDTLTVRRNLRTGVYAPQIVFPVERQAPARTKKAA